MRWLFLIFLIIFAGCHKDDVSIVSNNPPVTLTPVPIATPNVITMEDCAKNGEVWLIEDGLCVPLSNFNLPITLAPNIDTDSVLAVQKNYATAKYSIEKTFNKLIKINHIVIVASMPTKVSKENDLYTNPKAIKSDIETAILEKSVNDAQLECTWQGFAGAQLKHIITVRNMFLKQVKKLPILNSVTFGVSGTPLEKSYQLSLSQTTPNVNNYNVNIDPSTLKDSDITEILKQLK